MAYVFENEKNVTTRPSTSSGAADWGGSSNHISS